MAQAMANRSQPSASSEAPQEGQNNTTESGNAPAEARPEATEKALSPQYAALARKEKAVRQQVQQFKQEQAKFKAEQEAFTARQTEIDRKLSILDRLDKDPFGVLTEKGVTYDQITAAALNQPSPQDQAIARLEARIKAQDEALERSQKAQEETQTNQYQQAVKQIEFEAKALVNSDPAFESIKHTGSVKEVVTLIERTFKEDGILLSVEEAAQEVEKELSERLYTYVSRIDKVRQRLNLKPDSQKQQAKAAPMPATSQQPQMKTLTNSVGTTRQLSARERALLAFEGKLAK